MSPTIDLTKTYLYAEGADLVRVNTETLWPRLMSNVPAGPAEERVANGSGWLIGVFQYAETGRAGRCTQRPMRSCTW